MSTRELPIPIPVGAPHISNPPAFERWGLGPWRANRTDRRDYTRRKSVCDLWLVDVSGQSVLRCKTDDVSDAGLRATAPIGFGLAVGQRWQIRLLPPANTRQAGQQLGVPLGCGTVVRTEIMLDPAHSDRIGIALEFDVPQLVPA